MVHHFNLMALFGFTCASLLDTLHYITFSIIFLLGFGFDSNEKLTTTRAFKKSCGSYHKSKCIHYRD